MVVKQALSHYVGSKGKQIDIENKIFADNNVEISQVTQTAVYIDMTKFNFIFILAFENLSNAEPQVIAIYMIAISI